MTAEVVFQRVSVRGLRNLSAVDFDPGPRLNVIAGDNGQGKTSLLEALYLIASSRSFRTDKLREVVQDSQELAVAQATVKDGGQRRQQRVVLDRSSRTVAIDGKKPARLSGYATRTPVVVFHPGDLLLVSGPPAVRRTLLDRVALFSRPASADHRRRYLRALRERQHTLDDRGPNASELDVFEQLMAEHGAKVAGAHAQAACEIIDALRPAFQRLAGHDTPLQARYAPAGCDDAAEFLVHLRASRQTDLRRRAATFGPHRDEVELLVAGRSARRYASQGQQRILTLALKIAELECVRAARGAHPVLLLDDVSSELDPSRTGAVYDFLRRTESQVFVTTTRPELLVIPEVAPDERTDWIVSAGVLESVS